MDTDIVVIDSGVNIHHKEFYNMKIRGFSIIKSKDDEYKIVDDFNDTLGHGTAIYYLLSHNRTGANILMIKLFDVMNINVDINLLIYTLEYIYENINCKIIHMSFGIDYCDDIDELRNVCNKLHKKGIIIVSAYDNLGTLSYPAAFENVIGVDIGNKGPNNFGFYFIKNSPINIRFLVREQLLPFLNNEYRQVTGSSFMAPYITKYLIENYNQLSNRSLTPLELLENGASEIIEFPKTKVLEDKFVINKAIVLPFNKEVHSIVSNQDLLSFEILGIFDVKYLGNVGKKVSELLPYNKSCSMVIQDYSKIQWESDFDTVILSHVDILSNVTGMDFITYISDKCMEYGKKLYCFDDISSYFKKYTENGLQIYYPIVCKDYVCQNTFGKLRCINKPIIAVMGTTSKQGKFTLQLKLRRYFINKGYSVGQIGTEPSSLLFGFDEVYAYGYNSSVKLTGEDSIFYINQLLGHIEDKNVDIIIAGSQSQTLHYSTGNLNCYSLKNVEFLLAIEPDIVILCVNYFDTIDYIKRTINFIQSFQECQVLSIVLYPVSRNISWSVLGNNTVAIPEHELESHKEMLEKEFSIPCFILKDDIEISNLAENIIDHFSI